MERLNGTTSGPVEYVIAEFNPLLPVSASENFHRPLSFILEKIHHLPIKKIQETLYAAAADPLVALKLKIEPGAPLLVQKRYIYTTDEMPAVLGTSYYNADSFAYSVEHQYI